MTDISEEIGKLADRAGATYRTADGTFVFYETDLYLFVQLLTKQIIDDMLVWRKATERHGDEDEYYLGYRHAIDDSVDSVINLGIVEKR